MESLGYSGAPMAYVESAEANDRHSRADEGDGLGAVVIVLTPFALAAWVAIGLVVYRAIT